MKNKVCKLKNHIPTILIVDDSNVNIMILSELLEEYNLLSVNDGYKALEIAKTEHVDIILLDIMMPNIDGYEVCKKLKEDSKTSDIPVVFITAKTDEESIDRAYKVGGIDYVTKPFKSKELIARVKTQLSVYLMRKELEEKISLIDRYVSFSTTDTEGVIIEVSEAFCKISGYSKDELIGNKHNILRHPDMTNSLYDSLWQTIKSGKRWEGEVKNKQKNGGFFWANVVITPRYDYMGNLFGYTAIRHDITNQKIVEKLSITDQLTDLYNRRYFNEMFQVEIKRSIRQKSFLAFAMLDIDFFKQYNDTYGHQDGDKILSRMGEVLKTQIHRAEDLIFRLGGEEFGLLINVNSYENARLIADGICKNIFNLNIEHNNTKIQEKRLTVSIGLICIDFSKESNAKYSSTELYKLADDELYKAKTAGRNRVMSVTL